MNLNEKTISSEMIFDGKVVKLHLDKIVLPDGSEAVREVLSHPGGVGVLAIDEDNNVLMVRQFRTAAKQVMLEIPAGKLEYDENPLECGIRELEEEAAAVAEEIIPLGYFFPTPAYAEEKIYLFFAKGLSYTKQNLDDGEFLAVERIPFDELYEMALNGDIIDAKTLIAILKAKKFVCPKG